MKKKILFLLLLLITPALIFAGCAKKSKISDVSNKEQMFVIVNSFWLDGNVVCYVIVDKETKVMYLVGYNSSITVMLDESGKPLLYDGKLK